jgi:hypothetical protein
VVDCSPSSVYDGEKQVAGLRLSPQPAHEQLTISLDNDQPFTALELFDLSGQRRLSAYSLSPQTRIDLSLEGLPAGIYLLPALCTSIQILARFPDYTRVWIDLAGLALLALLSARSRLLLPWLGLSALVSIGYWVGYLWLAP